jgi:hypothetical protein
MPAKNNLLEPDFPPALGRKKIIFAKIPRELARFAHGGIRSKFFVTKIFA